MAAKATNEKSRWGSSLHPLGGPKSAGSATRFAAPRTGDHEVDSEMIAELIAHDFDHHFRARRGSPRPAETGGRVPVANRRSPSEGEATDAADQVGLIARS